MNSDVVFPPCCLGGNSLFVELKRFLLAAISEEYRQVDQIPLFPRKSKRRERANELACLSTFRATVWPVRWLETLGIPRETFAGTGGLGLAAHDPRRREGPF